MASERGTFGRTGFIMAAVGSAIGLGNIWKFPYITYANDGGSFVLVYLAAIILIGAPIMLAEIVIGRRTEQSPVGAFRLMAADAPGGRLWSLVGGLGILTGFVLLSYYAVIAGWTVYYFGRCLTWSFQGFDPETAQLGDQFNEFLANPGMQLGFFAFFLTVTSLVVMLGVKRGIERVTKLLMPILGTLLVLLAIASIGSPGFGEAMRFLFHVGPITADGLLESVGHAFFTLSLGMGAMITYGSYVSRDQSIPRAAFLICLFDTVVAILACIIMFSIIFAVPEAERAGTFSKSATILFTTLPRMFYSLPLGSILAPVFYMLISFAALTSTIGLLEVVVSYFVDVRRWGRTQASIVVTAAIFLAGVPAALSLGAHTGLTNWAPLGEKAVGVFSVYDYLVSNWFLPVGGLMVAVFAGWIIKPEVFKDELELGHGPFKLFSVALFLLRFVGPIAICWILWAVIQGRSFA